MLQDAGTDGDRAGEASTSGGGWNDYPSPPSQEKKSYLKKFRHAVKARRSKGSTEDFEGPSGRTKSKEEAGIEGALAAAAPAFFAGVSEVKASNCLPSQTSSLYCSAVQSAERPGGDGGPAAGHPGKAGARRIGKQL